MVSDFEKVSILSEALPYIREFSGKTFVIKYGGASMHDSSLKEKVMADIALLHYMGVHIVLVHGGGPEINAMLERLNIKSEFRDGLRVTDQNTMEVVEMTLTGKVQNQILSHLSTVGVKAIGLSGQDGGLFVAKEVEKAGQTWGLTGEITSVNTDIIEMTTKRGYIPVISSIAPNSQSVSLNINADNAAYMIAKSIKAEKLIYLTDTAGILKDIKDPNSLIQRININEANQLMADSIISGGMIPKTENAISALQAGVQSVHILNGKMPHTLLLETLTSTGVGTMITN